MERVARQVRLTGRVQGVFLRAWTKEQADRLGICGWVRNCADGSVEAHFEGRPDSVERMVDLAGKGSSGARVEQVDVDEVAIMSLDRFEIRH